MIHINTKDDLSHVLKIKHTDTCQRRYLRSFIYSPHQIKNVCDGDVVHHVLFVHDFFLLLYTFIVNTFDNPGDKVFTQAHLLSAKNKFL